MKRKIVSILLAVLLILPVCSQIQVSADGGNYSLTAAQLALGECLGMVIYTDIPSSSAVSASVSINGRTKTLQPEIKDNKCVYRYQEIVPDELGMTITITAGNINTSFTCKDIAVAVLNMDGLSAETYELVSDLLRYGDAAAKFRGTSNDILTGNLGSHFIEKTLTCPDGTDKVISGSSSDVALSGITYYFNNYNRLCLVVETENPGKVTTRINGINYPSSRLTEYENGKYLVYSEAIPARTLNSLVNATIMYEGSSVISVTYSPHSYANAIGSDPNTSETDKYLAYALYQYAKSAAAYAETVETSDSDPSTSEWLNADNNLYLQSVDKSSMTPVEIENSDRVLGNDIFHFNDDDPNRTDYLHVCGQFYTHAESALVNVVFCFPKNVDLQTICSDYEFSCTPDLSNPPRVASKATLSIIDHKLYLRYTYSRYDTDGNLFWGYSSANLPVCALNKDTCVLTQITDETEITDGMEVYAWCGIMSSDIDDESACRSELLNDDLLLIYIGGNNYNAYGSPDTLAALATQYPDQASLLNITYKGTAFRNVTTSDTAQADTYGMITMGSLYFSPHSDYYYQLSNSGGEIHWTPMVIDSSQPSSGVVYERILNTGVTPPPALPTLDAPVISQGTYGIYFDNVDGATYYDIYRDGELLKSIPAAAESQSGVQRLTGTTWTLPSAVSRLSDHTYNIKALYGANEYETLKFQSGQSYSPVTS